MPQKGDGSDGAMLLYDSYCQWVDAQGVESLNVRLIDTSIVQHLLDDLSKHFGKNRTTFTLPEAAKKARRELAAAPGVGSLTMRYLAAIFRHHGVETPDNWHLTEKAPPQLEK